MFNRITQLRSTRRGNAILDAAFVLPILISLTFGSIEWGYFFFTKHVLQSAARDGARTAITVSATNTKVTQAVITSLYNAGLNSSPTTLDAKYALTITPSPVLGQAEGTPITVRIDCNWGSFNVRPLGLISATKVVRGTTVMRKEG